MFCKLFNNFKKHPQNKIRFASSSIFTKDYINYSIYNVYSFNNDFIKLMNSLNPQLTGHIIEELVTDIFKGNIISVNEFVIKHSIQNYINNVNIFITQVKSLSNTLNKNLTVNSQDNLSFKKIKCCRTKEYRCFADITTEDYILDIKVVRKSFFLKDSIIKLSKVGLQYYNQLMCYAYGYKQKYNIWPNKLMLLNLYTGEYIVWEPNLFNYIHISKLI